MPETTTLPPNPWRHYAIGSPIGACRIQYDDLKRLFDLIDEKQNQEAQRFLGLLAQQPNETADQFDQRKGRVKNALVTLVSIGAPDGESVTGNTRDFFDSAAIPERIQSILIDTANSPKAAINLTPDNRLSLFLDFRRPPLLNYGVLPSAPTPNESNYNIAASLEPWATSLNSRIRSFFEERRTALGWLHKQGCYDALLMLVGLPLTLWASYRLGPRIITPAMPNVLITAIYVYLFFLLLNFFRIFFSYTRWVFPLVEITTPRVTWPQRHRIFWTGIIIAVLGGFAYDAIRFIAS